MLRLYYLDVLLKSVFFFLVFESENESDREGEYFVVRCLF